MITLFINIRTTVKQSNGISTFTVTPAHLRFFKFQAQDTQRAKQFFFS